MNDLIVRNATRSDNTTLDIAINEGKIVLIASTISGAAREEIDATGLHVFPGFVDAHVHFNEPGRKHWEGLDTGPRALAAGGGTCFFDMPLNSDPPVLDAERLNEKRRIAEEKSILDFALWGGLCPGYADKIDEMAEAGAIGFKAFLCHSGIEEFPAADAETLREGLQRARCWNLPVAIHAEDPQTLARFTPKTGGKSLRDFFASRPKAVEIASIREACEIAGETGGKLHVVHVSCAEGLEEIAIARKNGADVTAETCPHYLLFNAGDASKIGARAKCAPPLREKQDIENLWQSLLHGRIDTIGSDHSPAPPDMKTGDDFFAIWGGIAGCQHAFPAFLGELHRRAPGSVPLAAEWLSANPSKRFGLARKGQLAEGSDADLTFVEFTQTPPITAGGLLYRHPMSLYEAFRPGCRIVHVVRRGEQLVKSGTLVQKSTRGKFLRPFLENA